MPFVGGVGICFLCVSLAPVTVSGRGTGSAPGNGYMHDTPSLDIGANSPGAGVNLRGNISQVKEQRNWKAGNLPSRAGSSTPQLG